MERLTRSKRMREQKAAKNKKRREKGLTLLKKVTMYTLIKAAFLAIRELFL